MLQLDAMRDISLLNFASLLASLTVLGRWYLTQRTAKGNCTE
jgi:hypothetical protein